MKQKLTRRDFLRVSVLATAGAAFSACNAIAPERAEPVPVSPTPAPATIPPPAEKVKITTWSDDFLIIGFLTDRFNEYAALHPETEFEFEFVELHWPEITDKFISTLLTGTEAPDIIGVEQGWFPLVLKEGLAEQGLYDLNPWLEVEDAGFKDKFLRWELYSWAGKTYGIEHGLSLCAYYYRQDIFDRAGLDPNTFETYDDFIQAGQILKAKTGSFMTVGDTAVASIPLLFLLQNDGGIFDRHGEVLLDSSQSIEALQLYYDLVNIHQVVYGVPDFWGTDLQAVYQKGTIAGTIGADWFSNYILKETVKDQAGLWRVAALPAFKPGGRRTTVWGGAGWGITQQSNQADIAWQLLKHALLNQEQQVKKYLEINFFPTMLEAMTDPRIMAIEDPFFGDQPVGAIQAEIAPNIPFNYTHPYKIDAFNLLSSEVIIPVMAGEKSPEQALKEAAQKLRDMIIANK